jgi:hypothetical protein
MSISPMLRAAVDYALRDISVFPCEGKIPLTPQGFKNATLDAKQIADWWTEHPDAQIGIPTGRVNNLVVLDIDGPEGMLWVEDKLLPQTREVETSPGRRQFWFRLLDGKTAKCSAGVRAPQVDVRGEGGYVIAPPSTHHESGKPYRFLNPQIKPAEAPEWLLEPPRRPANSNGAHGAERIPFSSASSNGAGTKIPEGQRDNYLTSKAGTLFNAGLHGEALFRALWEINQSTCNPPKSDQDVRRIAASADRNFTPREVEPETVDTVAPTEATLIDMPEAVLDGWLGEICQRRLEPYSPRAYSWPALVAVASVLAHQSSYMRTNLFVALVGPVESGKSFTIDNAAAALGFPVDAPELERAMAGSAEGLLKAIGDTGRCARLYAPDELSHLFSKARIENASFAPILQRAFYNTRFKLVIAKQKDFVFNASLGICGGIVDAKFDECFDATTTAGLYSRFTFGRCPKPFVFDYRPFDGRAEVLPAPVAVQVHPEVWELKKEWIRQHKIPGRTVENALRVASICASLDGCRELRAARLAPTLAFALYQLRVQKLLEPNPGQNQEAACAFAIKRLLAEMDPAGKKWISKRDVWRTIHGERFGPGIFTRAGQGLIFNEEIEQAFVARDGKRQKSEYWRLCP